MSYTQTVTVKEYLQSKTKLCDRIAAIESLIDAMVLEMASAIGTSGTASYSMDDGQMKVTTEYRSISQITAGVKSLEQMKNIYVNRYNGHRTVLRGRLNFYN